MADFFDYQCDNCGKPFCERIHVMNMVLNLVEEEFCLECLAENESRSPETFYYWIIDYVMARDCFKGPWEKFNPAPCPRITDKSCFCKVSA
jgi:hypothetical protein